MQTGEDINSLRKIIDFIRMISIFILALHFYISCFAAFQRWHWTATITTRIVTNIAKTGLFNNITKPKLGALLCLVISLIGSKGRKDEKIQLKPIIIYLVTGLLIYFISALCFYLNATNAIIAIAYMGMTTIGYLLILTGGGLLSRLIKNKLNKDVFNTENETFPQEERLLENDYSFNLRARYRLKGKTRDSWVNIINPHRSLLLIGSAGAGKTYFVIQPMIDQAIRKGSSLFIYDFKFDDLTKIAYNKLLQYQNNYTVKPKFYVINFEDPCRSHRCNPLEPLGMSDITDATEASRTIMLGLNRDWAKKQGDFFVESAINFLTAIIWYLRKYRDGKFCTLPHVLELMQLDYDSLFAVLQQEEEIKMLINPFVSALLRKAAPQLEGQIGSTKIALARLSSPQLYYVLSGNDFTLDINDPAAPKIVCLGNNPLKIQSFGPVASLFATRSLKVCNQKNKLKSVFLFDEYPTLAVDTIPAISTGRSNLMSVVLGIQSVEQLKDNYGTEKANVITSIGGNLICGQQTGDAAKKLSETFGKIMQRRESQSINSSDTSITRSTQLDYAIPASTIASLSSGEFVGFVADNPDQRIPQKMFHCAFQNDHGAIAKETAAYKELPQIRLVTAEDVQENYQQIKSEIAALVRDELAKLEARKPKKAEEAGDAQAPEPGDDDPGQRLSI
ncbi:YWFCY domain-containing protein [Mucilaginibacter sp. BJC16-A38]|uniref:conjugal transfer protein MobC n=1 Tax=Mucilaginibacter phenanthrenivorans TaxID=1234842 RepID=UPI0021570408|nr:conjugal transfer protein MobC [Mucilaginibacter phenanthrenivorans]MCR8557001.1 YWFCY domain-containing protein [Mucilaginibacter phenanthrenivorans]